MLLPHLIRRHAPFSFDPFENLHREFGRFFTSTDDDSRRADWPPVNIWKTDTGLALRAEIPGVRPEDLEITVHENRLKIGGSRPAPELDESSRLFRQERDYGKFERSFELPFRVDPDRVKAEIADGILNLDLPQLEADRPRTISVNVTQG